MKEVLGISLILIFAIYSLAFIVVLSNAIDTDLSLDNIENEDNEKEFIDIRIKQRRVLMTMFYGDLILASGSVLIAVLVVIRGLENILSLIIFIFVISVIKIGLSIYNLKQITDTKMSIMFKKFKDGDDIRERISHVKEMKE